MRVQDPRKRAVRRVEAHADDIGKGARDNDAQIGDRPDHDRVARRPAIEPAAGPPRVQTWTGRVRNRHGPCQLLLVVYNTSFKHRK